MQTSIKKINMQTSIKNFCLFYRSVSLVSTPVYAFTASRGLSSLVLGRSLLLLPRAVNKGC